MVLGGIVTFVLRSNPSNSASHGSVIASANGDARSDPLDQVSTSDIAVNLAQMAHLAETPAVTNQADSASTELIVPAQNTVIAKPQAVTTELKSNRDITSYVVQNGDTIASIAAKFNVTSESILWSNNITGNAVAAGTKLVIPPVTGIVYTVAGGDTPDSLAQKFRASKEQIIAYNDAEISGLQVGKQIIIPNGQQLAVVPGRSSYASGSAGFTAAYGYNGYDYGFCTWYVANRRTQVGRSLPSNLGNASTWDNRASAMGLSVNKTPAVGAAAVTSQSGAGHVVFVEQVNSDGSIWVTEMNSSGQVSMTNTARAGGWGKVDWKLFSASQAASFNYIH
jgi:surface antigen